MSDRLSYQQHDHQLRSLLFGAGATSDGYVKGEAARLNVAEHLNAMQEWSERVAVELRRRCVTSLFSSRMCEYGTKGCDVYHMKETA